MNAREPYPSDLTDNQWSVIEDLAPKPKPGGRPAKYDRRAIINGLGRYAWAGLPRVWIANLANHFVEVHTRPSGRSARPGYADCEIKRRGDVVPVLIGGKEFGAIPVDSLLL